MTQYGFKKALRLCPGRAKAAVGKELKQLHSRDALVPQDITQLTHQQKKMALESIMTVSKKRNKPLKGLF